MNTKLLTFLIYFGVFSISASAQNLLTNGNFEAGFSQWTNLNGDGSTAVYTVETTDIYEGAKAMKVEITVMGTNSWSVQSIHSAWPSVSGTEYRLRFYAKALTAGLIARAVQQINASYASNDFSLTTSWQQYEWIFTAGDNNLEFKFHFPAELGTILIDNVTIEPTTPAVVSDKDTLKIISSTHFQTMEGFGASQAYYESWVTNHPNKEELYKLVFQDLGLDWLRLQNVFRDMASFAPADAAELVQKANTYTFDSVRILMSSWSPPAALKSSGSENGGTLAKDANNDYVYGAFGDYWMNSLTAYANAGIHPNWISIQNEPDWEATYSSCKFAPTETASLAGYDKALDSVNQRIMGLPNKPLLLGAEPTGIGGSNFNDYTDPIKNKNFLFGYAYHLYNGGDPNSPDSYNASLSNIGQNYSDRPNIMTEYQDSTSGWLKEGWLINNVLTKANASAYFYWDLIWPNHGLIGIDNPWNSPATWKNPKGYTVNPQYYAFKHFSRHIKAGYIRVSGENSNSTIRSSAFISPSGDSMVFVMINTSATDVSSSINIPQKNVDYSAIFQSAGTSYYQYLGSMSTDNLIHAPANSITTVVMKVSSCTGSPVVHAGSNQTICSNVSAVLAGTVGTPATGGKWVSSGSGSFSPGNTDLNATYTPSQNDITAGSVTLILSSTGTGVCSTSGHLALTINTCTGINKTQKAEGIKVYPVPTTQKLTIDLENRKDVSEVTVINSIGVRISEYNNPGSDLTIDVDALPQGLYMLVFKTSGGDVFTKQFIKNE
jgi:glucuronoarabinoxylan endo-1,4-beta-xylanase